jgi:hypothetical protein
MSGLWRLWCPAGPPCRMQLGGFEDHWIVCISFSVCQCTRNWVLYGWWLRVCCHSTGRWCQLIGGDPWLLLKWTDCMPPSAIIFSLRTLLYAPFILLGNLIWASFFIYYSEDNENDLAPLWHCSLKVTWSWNLVKKGGNVRGIQLNFFFKNLATILPFF